MTARLTEADKVKRAADNGFAQGVAYAAAYLVHSHGEMTLAAFLLGDTGMSIDDFRKARCAGHDLRVVSRLYRTEPYLERPASATTEGSVT